MLLSRRAQRLIGMGLVITPLETPRRFNPLAQSLEASQKLGGRELVWRFDGGDITSDGGVLALKKLEERTGIVRRFAACFTDYRKADQIEHPLLDLIMQRIFGLALGYEDLNDHDDLRRDPMLAVALGKDDVKGEQRRRTQDRGKALAGKSTLNRLELTAPDYDGNPRQKGSNKPETKKIVVDPESIDALLADLFLEAHAQAPERIVLDLDATDDVLYGKQEGRFYHGYYHDYCYLPLYVFCGEHLLCARLRMSNIDASADSVEELEPVIARIRQRWPLVKIQLRGDAGFCPRGSPKTGHRGSLQNRPTITIIQDVDFDARAATLGRCEQCLERGKEAASHSIWPARLVAAQDSEDHRCPPRNRR